MNPYSKRITFNDLSIKPKFDFFLVDQYEEKLNKAEKSTMVDKFNAKQEKITNKIIPNQGKHVHTQIDHRQVFNFDKEVRPIVILISTKILEQSIREVRQEKEMETIKNTILDQEVNYFNKKDYKVTVFLEKKRLADKYKILNREQHYIKKKQELTALENSKEDKVVSKPVAEICPRISTFISCVEKKDYFYSQVNVHKTIKLKQQEIDLSSILKNTYSEIAKCFQSN